MAALGSSVSGSKSPPAAPLLLMGRRFTDDLKDGSFRVAGKGVHIGENHDASQGTGLNVWDGSILLAKAMEHILAGGADVSPTIPLSTWRQNKPLRVLELGCGTGLGGISAALARPKSYVVLSDLPYTLGLAEDNAKKSIPAGWSRVAIAPLDWTSPMAGLAADPELARAALSGGFDLVLGADVVWLKELVLPLVRAMRAVARVPHWSEAERERFKGRAAEAGSIAAGKELPKVSTPILPPLVRPGTEMPSGLAARPSGIAGSASPRTAFLVAHQTRSIGADKELFSLLREAGFSIVPLPLELLHPEYTDRDIQLLQIVLEEVIDASSSSASGDAAPTKWEDEPAGQGGAGDKVKAAKITDGSAGNGGVAVDREL